jgi:hypothetical protein
MELVTAKQILLKNHPTLSERWLHERLIADPTLLGLGDLEVRDSERRQPRAGRLDVLLSDPETLTRYEVEIQLGASDETHIIRTIEYWDIERRRYPQYEHVAVIVAEDITSRFLNVISLFNGFIPLIAIQLHALQVGESFTLVATRVLDLMTLGTDEEEEGAATDRSYWEVKGSRTSLQLVDELVREIQQLEPGLQAKYNKHYVGLAAHGVARNFVLFRPRKQHVIAEFNFPPTRCSTLKSEPRGWTCFLTTRGGGHSACASARRISSTTENRSGLSLFGRACRTDSPA